MIVGFLISWIYIERNRQPNINHGYGDGSGQCSEIPNCLSNLRKYLVCSVILHPAFKIMTAVKTLLLTHVSQILGSREQDERARTAALLFSPLFVVEGQCTFMSI